MEINISRCSALITRSLNQWRVQERNKLHHSKSKFLFNPCRCFPKILREIRPLASSSEITLFAEGMEGLLRLKNEVLKIPLTGIYLNHWSTFGKIPLWIIWEENISDFGTSLCQLYESCKCESHQEATAFRNTRCDTTTSKRTTAIFTPSLSLQNYINAVVGTFQRKISNSNNQSCKVWEIICTIRSCLNLIAAFL